MSSTVMVTFTETVKHAGCQYVKGSQHPLPIETAQTLLDSGWVISKDLKPSEASGHAVIVPTPLIQKVN